MPGSSTTPGRTDARAVAPIRIAFHFRHSVGTRDEISFAAQWLAYALPYRRFAAPSRAPRTARGRCGSLLLHRSGLSPPTPCRFHRRTEYDSRCGLEWRPARMVRPYSLDLRERVVAAAEAGQSCRTVADRFGVSVASVVKWRQRARAMGSPAAMRMGGRRPVLLAGRRAWILQKMSARPDLSIRGLMAELAEAGTIVSYGAVWTFLHRQGLSHKKKPTRQRAGSTRRRPTSRPLEKASASN